LFRQTIDAISILQSDDNIKVLTDIHYINNGADGPSSDLRTLSDNDMVEMFKREHGSMFEWAKNVESLEQLAAAISAHEATEAYKVFHANNAGIFRDSQSLATLLRVLAGVAQACEQFRTEDGGPFIYPESFPTGKATSGFDFRNTYYARVGDTEMASVDDASSLPEDFEKLILSKTDGVGLFVDFLISSGVGNFSAAFTKFLEVAELEADKTEGAPSMTVLRAAYNELAEGTKLDEIIKKEGLKFLNQGSMAPRQNINALYKELGDLPEVEETFHDIAVGSIDAETVSYGSTSGDTKESTSFGGPMTGGVYRPTQAVFPQGKSTTSGVVVDTTGYTSIWAAIIAILGGGLVYYNS